MDTFIIPTGPKWMDIISAAGTVINNGRIRHHMGKKPGMVMAKRTDEVDDWRVYDPHGWLTDSPVKLGNLTVFRPTHKSIAIRQPGYEKALNVNVFVFAESAEAAIRACMTSGATIVCEREQVLVKKP